MAALSLDPSQYDSIAELAALVDGKIVIVHPGRRNGWHWSDRHGNIVKPVWIKPVTDLADCLNDLRDCYPARARLSQLYGVPTDPAAI